MQAREKRKRGRCSRWSVQRSLERSGSILRNALDKALLKESTAGFDGTEQFHIHRVLLAIVENEERICIDNKLSAIHDPGHLALNHRFDGKRASVVRHVMPSRRGMKNEVVLAHLRTFREQVRDSSRG